MHFGKRLEQDMVDRWRPHYLQYKLLKKHIKEIEKHLREGTCGDDEAANGLLMNQQISYQEFTFPGPKAHRYTLLSSFKPILDKEVEKINQFTTSRVIEIQNRILQVLRTPSPLRDTPSTAATLDSKAVETFLEYQGKEADTIAQELIDLDKFIRQNCIAIQKIIKKFDKRLQFDVAPWLNAQLMENEPFLKVNLDALLIALSDTFEKIASVRVEYHSLVNKQASDVATGKKGISAQTFERKTTKYWVRSENLMTIKVSILKNLPCYLFDRKGDFGFKGKNFLLDFNELYGEMSDSSPITSIYLDNANLDVYHSRLAREESSQLFRLRWYGDAKSLAEKDHVFVERKTHHESWVLAKSVKERFPVKTKNVQAFLEGKFIPAESMRKWMKPDQKGVKLIKNEDELERATQLSNESFDSIQKRKLKPMVRTLYRRAAFQARDHNEVRISIDTQLMMVNEDVQQPGSEFPWCRDMAKTHIPPSDILLFPYSILEVKLNCDNPPLWIQDVFKLGLAIECHKFSKFLTGIAYHQYEKVRELPHWFKDEIAIDPRNRFLSNEQKEKLIASEVAAKFADQKQSGMGDSESESSDKCDHQAIEIFDEAKPLLSADQKLLSNNSSTSSIPRVKNSPGFLSSLKFRFGMSRKAGQEALKPVRSQNRIKIEPKTSFANERTLIQWVSAASLMITLATLIMTSGSEMGFKAGFVFFPLAFVIMLYAIVRYQYRAWSFRHRRNQFQDDLYGPVFLVIAIASAMGVIMYLMFHYSGDLPHTVPIHDLLSGCTRIDIVNSHVFPISDLALNGDQIVISGPFKIMKANLSSLSWSSEETSNEKITAVSFSPYGSLYALVEQPSAALIRFGPSSAQQFDLRSLKDSFELSMRALTFVDESKFLLADKHGSVYVGLITHPDGPVELVAQISSEKLTLGMIDEDYYKEIGGLYYEKESKKLYVLFSNYRTLRMFDFHTMDLLQQWYLPGTSFKWSGVAIANSSDIYLSQSIPSGVWKFKINSRDEKTLFPACANVYDGDLVDMIRQSTQNDRFKRSRPTYVSTDN